MNRLKKKRQSSYKQAHSNNRAREPTGFARTQFSTTSASSNKSASSKAIRTPQPTSRQNTAKSYSSHARQPRTATHNAYAAQRQFQGYDENKTTESKSAYSKGKSNKASGQFNQQENAPRTGFSAANDSSKEASTAKATGNINGGEKSAGFSRFAGDDEGGKSKGGGFSADFKATAGFGKHGGHTDDEGEQGAGEGLGGFSEFFSGLDLNNIINDIFSDKDKMLIAMMLFVLWRQKADIAILIALGYILIA